jgi:hypothetical protein
LAINVLDQSTKDLVQKDLEYLPDFVGHALEVEPTEKQVYNLKAYIKEFAKRRSLNLNAFPTTLATWIEQ